MGGTMEMAALSEAYRSPRGRAPPAEPFAAEPFAADRDDDAMRSRVWANQEVYLMRAREAAMWRQRAKVAMHTALVLSVVGLITPVANTALGAATLALALLVYAFYAVGTLSGMSDRRFDDWGQSYRAHPAPPASSSSPPAAETARECPRPPSSPSSATPASPAPR